MSYCPVGEGRRMLKNFSTTQVFQQKKVPLRLVLIVPFVLQIFAAVGLTGWLSLRHGQKAVNDVASQLRNEIATRIQEHLQQYVEIPHLVNQLNANTIELGQVNLQDPRDLERHFWKQMQSFVPLSAIYFSTPRGEFFLVKRITNDTFQVAARNASTEEKTRRYTINRLGERGELVNVNNYDPRVRPWYLAALEAGRSTWSHIYPNFLTQELGITAAQPLYDDRGQLLGVLGSDFLFAEVNRFIRSLKIGRSGKTFIIDREGLLVSTSTLDPVIVNRGEDIKRILATESENSLIRLAAKHLEEKFDKFTQIDLSQQLNFEIAGARQFLQVTPLGDSRGLNWLIVIVVPEADFMEQINANTRTTMLLCLGALVLSTVTGIFAYHWIGQPILHLSTASKELAKRAASGELASDESDQTVEGSIICELEVLARSFNQMASQLHSSFTFLAKMNEELEKRVEKRTAELRQDAIDRQRAEEVLQRSRSQLLAQAQQLEQRVEQRTSELAAALEAAEAVNLAKSNFLAKMSHQLRTPLNAILGFAQLMDRDESLSTEQRENLEIIGRSGEHLLDLIEEILSMSKLETGRARLQETSFDLYHLLADLEEIFQPKAASKQLQLIFECGARLPQYVKTDEGKLRQVLISLLDNGIKFTVAGSVTLTVNCKQIGDRPNAENLRMLMFELSDTGLGIAPDELKVLFEPFVQAEAGRHSIQGASLGLPISRQFVQLMGGEMTVSSKVGFGTTFKFEVRIATASVSAVRERSRTREAIALEPGQPTYRILVVEDQWENRKLLTKLLKPLGFEVCEAVNGEEAIRLWESWEPHLIWMDIRMPVMDGYEATKQIKSKLKGQSTTIIALTANAFEEDRAIALSVGCDDFLSKPFQKSVLLEKMAKHLGVRYVCEQSAEATSS